MTNDADFIKDFLIESHENLDKIDGHLLVLEKNPTSPESLAEIFRAFHTIKGTSRFFSFKRIEALTHAGEDILSRLRDGRLAFGRTVAGALLGLADEVRGLLKSVEATGQEGTKPAGPANGPMQNLESTAVVDGTLRVGVEILDRLMAEVGELVLARNQLMQRAADQRDGVITAAAQKLNFIISDLQTQVVKVRLQPMSSLWNRFPRLVRDLCLTLNKEVKLLMEGADIELDKSLLEAIKDPLMHLVRNAVDHGIEKPEARRAAGKPLIGELKLRAFHEGGIVHIELSDDGAGLHTEAIRAAAVSRGVVTAEDAGRLGEAETWALIFTPGFSTASEVTSVSGRGVGLDVVKTNIEKIGGSVDVHSVPGKGAVFRVKIPLTLAIVPALLVVCQGQRYAIPQMDLLEMVRLRPGGAARIEWVQDAPVYRLRGRLLPIVFLGQALGAGAPVETSDVCIVVLRAGRASFGLVVDRVLDTEEIVVKPLGRHLKSIPVFEGATILGDGRAALILNVPGLAQTAHVVRDLHGNVAPPEPEKKPEPKAPTQTFLLFAGPDNGRMAIPLSDVVRLEEFPPEAFERVGSEEVVNYHGEFLRVLRMASLVVERRRAPRSAAGLFRGRRRTHMVVCRHHGRAIGLVVDKIMDIVEEPVAGLQAGSRECVKGTTLVRGRVTELLDIDALMARARPSEHFPEEGAA